MKLRVLPLLAIFVSLVCIAFLGYRGYQWWQKYEKKKALFLYFQKNSPVTKRIPRDTLLYVNLYDLKRVHDQLRDTDISQVLAHWLDTGMSENEKPNPLLGGMLEKTILNIVGDEFAVALLPSKQRPFDFLAVARIAPGSDFLLNLALSSAKNIEKIDSGDKIFYRSKTKDANFPTILIYVQENLAYASNSFQRLKESYSSEGNGPDSLSKSAVEAIPEDTILFAQLQKPQARALLHGNGKVYRLQISDLPAVPAHVPEIRESESDVLRIQTNSPGFIGHPSVAYVLQSISEEPVSAVLLSFTKSVEAANFEQSVAASFNPEIPESFSQDGIQCLRHSSHQEEFICRKGVSLLLARGQFSPDQAEFLEKKPAGQSPFIFRIQFQKNAIRQYHERVQNKDWSVFSGNEPFYFLSCIKQVTGGIDKTGREIGIELE
ncbi:DUF3352 domain-containing protein [bacterium]|nr:DUF3352 domain-containing protein [bacterium]MCI0605220.1 DUF3352 domain-containing protein [bacterium]